MSEILDRPYKARSVWTADELRNDDSWIHLLSDGEIAELEEATRKVLASGKATYQFGKEDFDLPTVAAVLEKVQKDLEEGRGIYLIRGLPVTDYDDDFAFALYWGIACHIGLPITQNSRGDLIGEVKDRGRDYFTKNVRGYTTNNGIRAHCDSSDVVGLLCMHPAQEGGESLVMSSGAIFNRLLERNPAAMETLFRGYHFDLRGEGSTDDPEEVTRHRVPVFSYHEGLLSCRYNQKTIEDGMTKAGKPLEGDELEAVRAVGQIALEDGIRFDMDFQVGDIQLLNNHTTLHARTDFEDYPEPERKRRLLRLWLNLPNGRPLTPEFAERLNTGPRGGVAVRQAAE
jgi:hypothetical protein